MAVGPKPDVAVRVFGAIGVEGPDGPVSIGGHRQRRLLALLVVRTGSVVSIDWLAEHLWHDDDRPEAIAPRIRTYVSRLRQALPTEAHAWITTEPAGYRFSAPIEAVEHRRFTALRAGARTARDNDDRLAAMELLDEALFLWRGTPFTELEDLDWARAETEGLELDRLEMLEERWETALALGRHTQITGELAAFTVEHGDRDRAVRQHALALHRSGRTPDALRAVADHRRLIADASGLDPSLAMVQLETALLTGDPALLSDAVGRPLRGYQLLEEAGRGAFSVVWRGMQPSVNREVAIKQIRPELASQPDFIRRFEAEAHLVARLQHPHIVPLIDYWRDPDSAYLVMRWLSGGTLERRLDDGPLTVAGTLALARQIGDALTVAHDHGVIHRDVKTANILYDEMGNSFLGDFGIALEAAQSAGPEAALSPGSPVYASPEQLRREPLGPPADVFSLGVVVFECLTGRLPFPASSSVEETIELQLEEPFPSVADLRHDVPQALSDAIATAMAGQAADRFSTIAKFLSALGTSAAIPRRHSNNASPEVIAVSSAENPYIGLLAFDSADSSRFFGRERIVHELVSRLSGNSVASRCVVIVGPSGSGKSSIVRAGLIPALRGGATPTSADWFSTTMVPGADPFQSLEAALLQIAVDPPPDLSALLSDGDRGILRAARRCLPNDDDRVVVVIDQFEELFTAGSATDTDLFLNALTVAVEDPTTPLRLVATLRADYYSRPLEHPTFAPIVKEAAVDMTPLAADELERSITEPARQVGVGFETGLVARIVADTTGQPSPLPMLQYTLSELFDRRDLHNNVLTRDSYDRIGGIAGAVAARAEGLYSEANDDQQAAIRRVFGRMTNSNSDAIDVRRRVPLAEFIGLPSNEWVVEQFAAGRLLTFDRDNTTREPTIEVAHEALLRGWPRLADWLQHDRELLRSVDAISTAANTWNEGGCQPGDLYRKGRLVNAIEVSRSEPDRLSDIDSEFIKASTAAAEHEDNTERLRVRRLRRLVAGVAVGLLAALVAGGFAVTQQRRAKNEARSAEAAAIEAELATLISRSAAQSSDAPDLAVLLALEAYRRAPVTDSEQAVLNALGANTIARRVGSFASLDAADSCSPPIVESSGWREFGLVAGQMVRRDLATGAITEIGTPPQDCVQWMADETLDVQWARTLDGNTMWWGPFGGPWQVEREFESGTSLWKSQFSSSGRMFFFADTGGIQTLLVLDDKTGQTIQTIDGGGALLGFDVSPDGSLFAVGYGLSNGPGDDGLTMVFDSETGTEIFRVVSPLPASRLIFDDSNRELVAGIVDGTVLTIDLDNGQVVSSVETGATSNFIDMELVRSDGLLSIISRGQIELIDRRTGPVGEPIAVRGVFNARIRSDETVLVLTSTGLSVLDPGGNSLVEAIHRVEPFANVAITNGRAVAVTSDSDPVIIDLATGGRDELNLTTLEGEPFASVFASPVPGGVVAINDSHVVARWEAGRMVGRIDLGGTTLTGAINGNIFAVVGEQPDGQRVVSLVVLDSPDLAVPLTIAAPKALAARPLSGGGVLILDSDGTLRTFDSSGDQSSPVDTGAIDSQVMAHDSATGLVAIGSGSGGVVLVDTASGEVEPLPGSDLVAGLGFLRGGEILAITSFDGTVRLWDIARGASAGVIWDGSGSILLSPIWYDQTADSVWVSTSGQIAEVSLDPKRWVERACETVGRDFTQEEWDRFVPGGGQLQSACS